MNESSEVERKRRLVALVEWVTTEEAREEVREATDHARKDAEMFLRMDNIDRDVPETPFGPIGGGPWECS